MTFGNYTLNVKIKGDIDHHSAKLVREKIDMSIFEKIIYVADLVSDDREYPDAREVRELAEEDLDKTLLRGLSFTIEDNAKKNKLIHIDTVKAYNYLAERIR